MDLLDDVAPRATGREAIIDKRKGAAQDIHAAARAKEDDRVSAALASNMLPWHHAAVQ